MNDIFLCIVKNIMIIPAHSIAQIARTWAYFCGIQF